MSEFAGRLSVIEGAYCLKAHEGGCFETSRPTMHQDPTYVVDGIVHHCVANMPGAVPLTSS